MAAKRRTFGKTWWGREWVRALEESSLAEAGRLSRARTYARQGRVTDLEVEPGQLTGTAWGVETYRASLSVKMFDDAEWGALTTLIASKAAYSASLLSGEMPPTLRVDAESKGIHLLPSVGDLGPDCSCPDWGDPCKHSAALCYMTAELIDTDPFVLFLLRGRDRSAVLDAVREKRGGGTVRNETSNNTTGEPRGVDPGIDAYDTYRRFSSPNRGESWEPPEPRPIPVRPARPLRLTNPPPADSGLVLGELTDLIHDAARRAVCILQGEEDNTLTLTVEEDLVRRAADALSRRETLAPLAERAELDEATLRAWATAWATGGQLGFTVFLTPVPMDDHQRAEARRILGERTRASGNALQQGQRQLRLGPNNTWWRFVADVKLGWVLDAGPFTSPAETV